MTSYYWLGWVNQAEFPEQADLIARVLSGEAAVDKLVNFHIYKTRINRKDRLFWTTQVIEGKAYIRILEVILNHDYQKSKYLKPGVFKQYLEKLAPLVLADVSEHQSNLDEMPCIPAAFAPKSCFYNQQFIQFNEGQQRAWRLPLPAIVSGPGGSGKSCVLFQVLHSLLDNMPVDEVGKILYVVQSKHLATTLKKTWGTLSADHNRVVFKDYDELFLSELDMDVANKVSDAYFYAWLDSFIALQRDAKFISLLLRDKKAVYEEFRIISAFTRKESLFTKEDYLKLGVKQSLFHVSKESFDPKPALFAAYGSYQKALPPGMWDPAFYDLNRKEQYYAIAVDEALDLSLLQLMSLYDLAKCGQIYYAMDSHQRLEDRRSQRALLMTLLTQQRGYKPAHIQLEGSHRCPNAVIRLVNKVIELKNYLTEGVADAYEISVISESSDLEKKKGEVMWLQPSLDEDAFLRTLGSANCVVITWECYREEAKARYGTSQVFTPSEIKGDGVPYIIAYRLLDDELNQFRQASRVLPNDPSLLKSFSYRPKRGQGQDEFALLFNPIISALERTMDKIFYVQDKIKALKSLILLLETGILPIPRGEASSIVLDHIANTEQDWYAQAERLIQNGNVDHALGIFLHELGKTPQDFEAFKTACEQTTLLSNSPSEVARVIQQEAMSPLLDERKISAAPIVHKSMAIKNKKSKSKSKKSVKVEEKSVVITRLLKEFTFENLDALFSLPNGISALSDFVVEDNDTRERCLLERIFHMASRMRFFCNYLIQSERTLGSVSLIDRIDNELIFPNGFSALHIAAHCDAADFIDIFSAKGKDVQRPNKNGEMPLYVARKQGSKKAEEALIRAGADYSNLLFQGLIVKNGKPSIPLFVAIDYGADDLIPATLPTLGDESQELIFCNHAPSILGASALFRAAQSGDLLAVRMLIERDDEDVNQVIGPRAVTPLLIAVQHGHFEVVQALLYGKVNVNQQAVDGTAALLIAAQFGFIEIASLLISTAEADVNLAGQFGCTPLMVATNRGDVDMVNLLIYCGANIHQAMTNQRTAYHLALIHGGEELLKLFQLEHVRLSLSMELMSSFTHAAVVKFFFDLSKVHYLTRKIEISGGYTSLFVHILKNPNYVAILCKVLETGDIGCLLFNRIANQLKFDDANTALHIAAELNCEQFINVWSTYTFDMNRNNKFGFKPIQLAVRHGQSAAVKALIRAGVDLDVEWNGLSLLHMAVDSNRDMSHFGVICLLLNSGADINEPLLIDKGETVLYIAAREGNASIVKLFLSKKANVNQACLDGMTPLMIACAKGYLDIVNQLLNAKADMMLRNEEGQDCFSLASLHPSVQSVISNRMQIDTFQEFNRKRTSSILNPDRFFSSDGFTPQDSTLPPHDTLRQHERPPL